MSRLPGLPKGRFRRLLLILAGIALLLYTTSLAVLVVLKFVDPLTTAVQCQRRLEHLLDFSYQKQYRFVPLHQVSLNLQHAVIAAEDGGFYHHHGIDWKELEKVVEENLEKRKSWRGGSTITQQLLKNLLLTTHFGFVRKAAEFALAPAADRILGKERILELYLNVIEWGPGIYGIEAASQHYYQIPATRLTREQSARLAACLPNPLQRRPQKIDWYADIILRRMDSRGW